MRRIPAQFQSPANEWYVWKPSPREDPHVKVLATLAPSNYPIGLKDTIEGGDVPVVWSNMKYRMIYMNMGHGDRIFDSAVQNHLFENVMTLFLRPEDPFVLQSS
jgi:type 1 glutamine amidotransferase